MNSEKNNFLSLFILLNNFIFASLATFYGYVIIDRQVLNPKTAFVTLFLFEQLRFAVYKIPKLIMFTWTTLISMRRILSFLNESEREVIDVEEFKDEVNEFVGKNKNLQKKTSNSLFF